MARHTVGARELKTRLGTYLQRVREGRTLVVTDRGQPVAELRPLPTDDSLPSTLLKLSTTGAVTLPTVDALSTFRPIRNRGASVAGCGPEGSRGSTLIQYFDASTLAKRYVHEPGSASVRRQLREVA